MIKALAAQSGKAVADNSNSAKPFESDDPIYWITQAMMPWGKDGGHWQVATTDQSRFEKQRRAIEDKLGPASMVWASHAQIQARQQKLFGANWRAMPKPVSRPRKAAAVFVSHPRTKPCAGP